MNEVQTGNQQVALDHLTPGAYLVRPRIGDQLTSQKVILE